MSKTAVDKIVLKQSKEWLKVKAELKSTEDGKKESNVVNDHIVGEAQKKLDDLALKTGISTVEALDKLEAILPKLEKRDVESFDRLAGVTIDKSVYSKTRSDLLDKISNINDTLSGVFDAAMLKGSTFNWKAVETPLKNANGFIANCDAHLNKK